MIRQATEQDIPRIVELAHQSLIDGPYAGIIEDKPVQMEACAREVLNSGKILLSEEDGHVGGLLGFVFAHHHFSGQPYAAELMWYVEKDARPGGTALKLLWEAEKLAKEMGAESMCFTAPSATVSALYARFGYKPLEMTFRKVFPCHS